MSSEGERRVVRLEALTAVPVETGELPEAEWMAEAASDEIAEHFDERGGPAIDPVELGDVYAVGGLDAVEVGFGAEVAQLMARRIHARRLVPRVPGFATYLDLSDENLQAAFESKTVLDLVPGASRRP